MLASKAYVKLKVDLKIIYKNLQNSYYLHLMSEGQACCPDSVWLESGRIKIRR